MVNDGTFWNMQLKLFLPVQTAILLRIYYLKSKSELKIQLDFHQKAFYSFDGHPGGISNSRWRAV